MSLVLLLALQAAPSRPPEPAAPVAPAAPLPIDFDLADVKPADRCADEGGEGGGGGSEIVVCGHPSGGTYDLERWARIFETGPFRAETGIARGAVAGAYVDQVAMPGGRTSQRALVGVKVKF
jgi:hypothetical protein